MICIAISYASAYDTHMTTFIEAHRAAVLASVNVVDTVRHDQLTLATPCAGWNLVDLLAHMTVQHRGFAAAARGLGADLAVWEPESVVAAVTADPAGSYAEAAHDVLAAFAAPGVDEAPFALPEFGTDAVVPGAMAMGFHFVDYVVHGWDVAATLGITYDLAPDVIDAVLPLVLAVPDGDFRDQAGSPFARAVPSDAGGDLDRILRHLGRQPEWARPARPLAPRD
jgi:uncharacterized protein (TIGR03086 family)